MPLQKKKIPKRSLRLAMVRINDPHLVYNDTIKFMFLEEIDDADDLDDFEHLFMRIKDS